MRPSMLGKKPEWHGPASIKEVKKMTFEEWLRQSSFVEPDAGTLAWLRDCWKAAQENKQ